MSVWHRSDEIPAFNQECLIYSVKRGWNCGKFVRRSDGDKWDIYGYFTPAATSEIIKWAYIVDLEEEK